MASVNSEQIPVRSSINEALADEFTCPICQEEYDEDTRKPKLLPLCLHTMCKGYIQQMLDRSINDQIRCPFDQQPQVVRDRNVDNLPTDRTLLRFLEYSEGGQAKGAIKSALRTCKTKIEELERVELRLGEEKSLTLAKIHEHMDGIIEHVNEEKQRLTEELEDAYENKRETIPALLQLNHIRTCVERVEGVLELRDTAVIVERKQALLSEMEMQCENRQDDSKQDANIDFVPKYFSGRLCDIKYSTKLEKHGGKFDQVKVVWQCILTFLIAALMPVYLKLEMVFNTPLCQAIWYSLFRSPFISQLRVRLEEAFKVDGRFHDKDEFYVYASYVLVHLGIYGVFTVLGHYYTLLNSSRDIASANNTAISTMAWIQSAVYNTLAVRYDFQYILIFEITTALYVYSILRHSVNEMLKKFKTINKDFLAKECAKKGFTSLVFLMVAGYITSLTALVPLLTITAMTALAFICTGFYLSNIPANNINQRENVLHFPWSIWIPAVGGGVVSMLCVSSVFKCNFSLARETSAFCTVMLLPLMILDFIQESYDMKIENKHYHIMVMPQEIIVLWMFAALSGIVHIATSCSQAAVPMPSMYVFLVIAVALLALKIVTIKWNPSENMIDGTLILFCLGLYAYNKNIEAVFEIVFLLYCICVCWKDRLCFNQQLHLMVVITGLFSITNYYVKMVFVYGMAFAAVNINSFDYTKMFV